MNNNEDASPKLDSSVLSGDYLRATYSASMAHGRLSLWRDSVPEEVWHDAAINDHHWIVEGLIVYWWKTSLNLVADTDLYGLFWNSCWEEGNRYDEDDSVLEITSPDKTGPLIWDEEPDTSAQPSLDELTMLLCISADLGESSIDPTPLCEFYGEVERHQVSSGPSPFDMPESTLPRSFIDAQRVIGRIEEASRSIFNRRLATELEQEHADDPHHDTPKGRRANGLKTTTDEAIKLFRDGLNNDAVAARTGLSVHNVRQIRSRYSSRITHKS